MPLQINSWVDEVNGGLVWVLTTATARELVLGARPVRSSIGPPSVAQAPSELNRLVCWLSEPAVTHAFCRNSRQGEHTYSTVRFIYMQLQQKQRKKSNILPPIDSIIMSVINKNIKMPDCAYVQYECHSYDGPDYNKRNSVLQNTYFLAAFLQTNCSIKMWLTCLGHVGTNIKSKIKSSTNVFTHT